jgi:hypothetical protein
MKWETNVGSIASAAAELRSRLAAATAEHNVRRYFDPAGAYSGAWFERLGQGAHGPNEIGCHDVLSLTLLDVRLPGLLTRDLLTDGTFGYEVKSRLRKIRDIDVWADDATDDLDAANDLWNLLVTRSSEVGGGAANAKLSKLLARKRPTSDSHQRHGSETRYRVTPQARPLDRLSHHVARVPRPPRSRRRHPGPSPRLGSCVHSPSLRRSRMDVQRACVILVLAWPGPIPSFPSHTGESGRC